MLKIVELFEGLGLQTVPNQLVEYGETLIVRFGKLFLERRSVSLEQRTCSRLLQQDKITSVTILGLQGLLPALVVPGSERGAELALLSALYERMHFQVLVDRILPR